MSTPNIRLIISGFALLLFGIILAITGSTSSIPWGSNYSYIPGGLGLLLVIISCSVKDTKDEK